MMRHGRIHRASNGEIQIVRVLNCERIENGCYTDIQMNAYMDETRIVAPTIAVEHPFLDDGIADVAIVDVITKQPLVIFEIHR